MLSNAERVTNFLCILFLILLDALDYHFKRIFNPVHPLIILLSNAFFLDTHLLTKVGLFINFFLLTVQFFFKYCNFLILIIFIQLILKDSTVRTYPLTATHLFILLEILFYFRFQTFSIIFHLNMRIVAVLAQNSGERFNRFNAITCMTYQSLHYFQFLCSN